MNKIMFAMVLVGLVVSSALAGYQQKNVNLAAGATTGSLTNTIAGSRLYVEGVFGVYSIATNAAETVTLSKTVSSTAIPVDTASVAVSNTVLKVDCDELFWLDYGEISTITRTASTTNGTLKTAWIVRSEPN